MSHHTDRLHIDGIDDFRRFLFLTSLVFATSSAFILMNNPRECEEANLEKALWITFGVQVSIFTLLLMHYIHLGCLIRKLGRSIGAYYFLLVGMMVWTQLIFFRGNECNIISPVLYYWLFVNILLFYVFVAYGLSLWGAYICWAQEEEEVLVKEAMDRHFYKALENLNDDERGILLTQTKTKYKLDSKAIAAENNYTKA